MQTKQAEIIVPTDLHDLSLGQYQEIRAIKEDEEIPGDDLVAKVFSIVTEVPLELVPRIKGTTVIDTVTKVNELLNRQDYPLITRFTMDGTTFGFIPDIEGSQTWGEYTNMDQFISEGFGSLHYLMAILFRPTIDGDGHKSKYRIEEYTTAKTWGDKMKEMPLSVALGGISFFERLGTELLSAIPSSLEAQIANPEAQQVLSQVGGGINHSISSLKETLGDFQRLNLLTSIQLLPT